MNISCKTHSAIFSLIVLLLAASCSPSKGGNVSAQAEPSASSVSDRLAAMSPAWRRATILRAIVENGGSCDRVTDTTYQQQVRGLAMWTARCGDGGHWAVYVGSQAYAQTGQCKDLAASGLPPCNPSDDRIKLPSSRSRASK